MISKEKLIALLSEGDNFISGQDLCAEFGVSRNAIWKAINGLRSDGYEIEAVQNKGYRLLETPDKMNPIRIKELLATNRMAQDLYYYDETDSTNTRIRLLAEEKTDDGVLAVADIQTAGRGRRGRTWITPAGMNIAMSLLLRPDIAPNDASMITLVMALATANGIEQVTGLETKIKWPNDIVVNGKKVVGILTEMDMEADYIRNVIVGIGINVNESSEEDFQPEFRNTATSLRIECGHLVERNAVIAAIMNSFEQYYALFLKDRDLSGLMTEYDKRLVSVGRQVRVLDPSGEYEAYSKGISDRGELIVSLADGTERHVYAGEVSVRGIYGYV